MRGNNYLDNSKPNFYWNIKVSKGLQISYIYLLTYPGSEVYFLFYFILKNLQSNSRSKSSLNHYKEMEGLGWSGIALMLLILCPIKDQ